MQIESETFDLHDLLSSGKGVAVTAGRVWRMADASRRCRAQCVAANNNKHVKDRVVRRGHQLRLCAIDEWKDEN